MNIPKIKQKVFKSFVSLFHLDGVQRDFNMKFPSKIEKTSILSQIRYKHPIKDHFKPYIYHNNIDKYKYYHYLVVTAG